MHTFDRALHCLKHPATVASIALLVVNDHILKSLAPSLFLLLTLSFKSTVKASAGVMLCSIALGFAVVPAAFTPFALWALGVIAEYNLALLCALCVALGFTVLGVAQARWRPRGK